MRQTSADAARLALTAGVDIEMAVQVPSTVLDVPEQRAAAGHEGKITMAQVNNDVRHVLDLKYLAGMFDHPLDTTPCRVSNAELTPANLGGGPHERGQVDGAARESQTARCR